ncbi:MAG: ACP S-malonyltransferase [Gemmatimonadetes bacterium]|nr:ACP S-malonyltransferase [Gemmatimonadota bacterium]
MGLELAGAYHSARATFEEADDVLGFRLSKLCWEGPEQGLVATGNAQPAILVHSVAVLRVIADQLGPVTLAAGHSLGEFTAWVAAGSLGFADAVRTVRLRGELMQKSGAERPGTMAAVLGIADEVLEQVCRDATQAGGDCVAANYNSPGQLVISGDVAAVERAMELARAAGARRVVRLNVSGAFHSPLMQVAQAGLRARLGGLPMAPPAFPVVSNVTAEAIADVGSARDLLVRQLTSPVRWAASMRTMLDAGVDRFFELGPGSVLHGLLKRIDRSAEAMAIGAPPDVAAFAHRWGAS